MKVFCSKYNPPLGGLMAVELYKSGLENVEIVWGNESSITLSESNKNVPYGTSNDLIRIIENEFNKSIDPLQKLLMNHWLSFSLVLNEDMPKALEYLDKTLSPLTYLVGDSLTASDLAVFSVIYENANFKEISKTTPSHNIVRWMKLIEAQEPVAKALKNLPPEVLENVTKSIARKSPQAKTESGSGRLQEGKFIELPHAEMGQVVVRFPPEASGYLHIGHAKAALLNQYYQQAFQGKLIMRFDDTNPAKENTEYEKDILEDVEMLEIKPDMFTHTSQYFDLMMEYCVKLIEDGKAFVDDTPAEQMKLERDQRIESKNRNNTVERNLELWEEMKKGSNIGVQCCVRAKIDMQSMNGCLRDPTIYRCKPEKHPHTGDKYKVYPTYDFACPIVDSVEGVTHVLRTMEYHDRDPQFYWFIDAIGIRKPYIWEYSRLNMTNTVLSKRKLTWFVEQGLVDGWDDPRMPTVRGVLRRGMTVEALRQFIHAQGSSRSVVFMEWDKIWAINKKIIDPIAPRYTTIEEDSVFVKLKGVTSVSTLTVPLHPKNPDIGTKTICVTPTILIDLSDAKNLKEGETATFINYGNVIIDKIHKDADGYVTDIDATPNLDNKDFKKTPKLTWIPVNEDSPLVETHCVYFDHIVSKPVLGKDEDFKKYIGHETRWEMLMLGEPELANVKEGDIIQLQRRDFFRVDQEASGPTVYTWKPKPLILFHIPDGSTKEFPAQLKTISITRAKLMAEENLKSLYEEIACQAYFIQRLKDLKSSDRDIKSAEQHLLELKEKYKTDSGKDWKEGEMEVIFPKPNSVVGILVQKITKQVEHVKLLKAEKAAKATIDEAVKILSELKAEYKSSTGVDWKPPPVKAAEPPAAPTSSETTDLNQEITKQGDLVRSLKSAKAEKSKVDEAVKILLDLKAKFKSAIGQDWKPVQKKSSEVKTDPKAAELSAQIVAQGDKVRKLKSEKVEKSVLDVQVKNLLNLKAQYKALTGSDWTPSAATTVESKPETSKQEVVMDGSGDKATTLAAEVTKQGDLIRDLKAKKAHKATIDVEVKKLLELKANYQKETGKAYVAPTQPKDTKLKEKKDKSKDVKKDAKPKEQPKPAKEESASSVKKVTRLGMEASKETDLPEWYSQVITKSEMIDYYDISGCYILRPWSYSIWDSIRIFLSGEFKKLGVKDGYFPIFVSKAALEREKTHIADFAPEVAWVTHSGSSELAEHIAVRPTSETAMYPAYARWIQSHRDLPYKLNQWNNVVRWEFKQPQPFLRTREFLWQEGHTAFRTKEEAGEEVLQILDLYARVYEDLLAIPVIKGRKTEKEKFAGADYTTTVEAYVPASGRAIQGATSHHLGQNFSKMFEIVYDDAETQEKNYVYQNSWGITTRTIGVMVLVHGDDKGLVLPPRIAEIQAIVVPCGITVSSSPEERKNLIESCKSFVDMLVAGGIRCEGDYRDNYSPGWKFNHWELKGVPVRVEIGPKDIAKGEVVAVQRFEGEKMTLKRDSAVKEIIALLERTHVKMLEKSTKERDAHLSHVTEWEEFTARLEERHLLFAPFCGEISCEDIIKNDSARNEDDVNTDIKGPAMGAKTLCIPFKQPRELTESDHCIHASCTNKPKFITLFGRSY